jgi:hypothetical protein
MGVKRDSGRKIPTGERRPRQPCVCTLVFVGIPCETESSNALADLTLFALHPLPQRTLLVVRVALHSSCVPAVLCTTSPPNIPRRLTRTHLFPSTSSSPINMDLSLCLPVASRSPCCSPSQPSHSPTSRRSWTRDLSSSLDALISACPTT